MANTPQASFLEILAEMGQLVFGWCTRMPWVILVVIVAWVVPPLGALITTFLAVHIYRHQGNFSVQSPNITISLSGDNQHKMLFVLGIFLIAMGLFWLVRYLTHFDFPWSILLILLGALMIAIGIGVGKRREDEQRKTS